ncbi:DNA/RNA nuclease SfsA [Amphritea opalescens]|uniref:Sugar fermentation stimulation protein homolog n=1 Tax=Amphritea opalescens TaxID=2490544 RepID=A0A430KME2_9GAMM|nr:DNA/RNA nuclease SfsA [Amphritea opalescens]RTE64647.1 DNA/RNA nuclease SfsA [Amphritea opalescens]
MQLEKMQSGRLIKRYKRFLADIELDSGEQLTVHCPNTGSMKNCADPGSEVWIQDSGNLKRKYLFGWELVRVESLFWACINTGRANALIREAIEGGIIDELQGYQQIRQEVKYGDENSRIDLLLESSERPLCYVEIKNVTLLEDDGIGSFPDAVTTRGAKHLRELMLMVSQGHRAVLMFCVPHTGIEQVRPADHIDPEYGRLLREAAAAGVEIYAYGASITPQQVTISHSLPVCLD